MAVAASAKRYAQAVFAIAREQDSYDQWLADLSALAQLAGDPGFKLIMESPRIPLDKKAEVLQERLPAIAPLAMKLAQLLIVKRRVEIIPGLLETYRGMLDARRGIEHVRAITAVPLEQAEQEALVKQIGERIGKEIVLTTEVDPSIIGGMILRIGDKLVEGSARGRLESLRRRLAEAR